MDLTELFENLKTLFANNPVALAILAIVGYIFFKKKPTTVATVQVPVVATTTTAGVTPVKESLEELRVEDLQSVLRLVGSITRSEEDVELTFRLGPKVWSLKSNKLSADDSVITNG